MISAVVPVRAVCDELGVHRKTFRVWENTGVIPAGATIEFNGTRYVLADRLNDVMDSIARHRAGSTATS